jgi:hypothetical protein
LSATRAPLAVGGLFLALGLLRLLPSLGWPMVYDDLHLVRTYTAAEVRGAWHGDWDPDGVETPGYRPLSLLFNHARAAALGEHVAAHRVFVMVLYAAYVALLVPLAARFGTAPGSVLLAGALMLAARHGTYHYVWITEGNHMLQGLAFAGAALLLTRSPTLPRATVALAVLAAGLLVREDTVAVVPVLLLLAWWRTGDDRGTMRCLAVFAVGAAALVALLFAYRAHAVPRAQPPAADWRSLGVAILHVLNPAGTEGWDAWSRAAVVVGWLVPGGLLAGLARVRPEDRRGPLLWLACAVITCTPALTFQRDDLLFFPGTFMALFQASAAAALARTGGLVRGVVGAAMAGLLAAATWVGVVFAENFHPDSTRALWWNTQLVYGEFAPRATLPPERRRRVVERLERAGVREGQQPRQRVRDLSAEARAAGRRRPAPDGAVFLPWLPEQF